MSSIAELFDRAVRCHQSGDLALADNLYRQVLQVDPRAADAWHLLGLLARQVGRHDLAVEYIGQALRLVPDFAAAHSNLGIVLRALGKLTEAEASCRQALRLQPDYAEAHSNLSNILRDQGKLLEAEAGYREALRHKPDYVEGHLNLGVVLQDMGQLQDAEINYREAVRLQPSSAAAHSNLGQVLRGQAKPVEAEACFRAVLRLRPDDATGHYNLGNTLRDQGKLEDAEANYRQALRLRPDHTETYNNLGIALRGQGKLAEAEDCWRAALRLQPDFAEVHSNLGALLKVQGRLEEAEACLRAALRLKPDYAEAYYNLGNVCHDQGKLTEAEDCWRAVLRLQPDFAEGHFALGLLWLLQGDLVRGWPEYEWRRRSQDLPSSPPPPTWDGHALDGQTILLQAEQGFGDTFQFVRYARNVKAQGGQILLQCPSALAGILAGCPGIDQLLPAGTPLPSFHVTSPLLSVPMLCGTTVETIPAEVPYLVVDPARVDRWRARLATVPGFKVGICWQGNRKVKSDRDRSAPLAHFAPLAAVPGVCLVALQRGPGLEQIAQNSENLTVLDLPGRSEEPAEGWLDTAALIQALDLVISTDCGVVHLAGALGASVWVALSFIPDWRWFLDREDSPWYPTMRLFRQRIRGDWADVFKRMATELQNYKR